MAPALTSCCRLSSDCRVSLVFLPLSLDPKLLTRMCHIEQRTGRITLHTHILRLCQADQRTQRSRASNLGLVLLVRSQIGYTADRITLHFHIRRHHLADQRGQPSEGDDQDLVFSYIESAVGTGHRSFHGAYHLQPDCQARRWRLVGLRYRSSGAERGWALRCLGRLRAHLQIRRQGLRYLH